MTSQEREEFERVIAEGRALQGHLPWLDMVAVGGTAAALHARHRYSIDTDHVTPLLRTRFEVVKEELRTWEGWQLKRERRPIALLGERHGVALGIRQLRRVITLEHEKVEDLVIPTAEETLRIKAFLCTDRQALRDYLDLTALADKLGDDGALRALRFLNVLYPGAGNQTCITRVAEVTSQEPIDLRQHDLKTYRGIQGPYDDWSYIEQRCSELARKLLVMELEGAVATEVEEFLSIANVQDLRQQKGETSGGGIDSR
jgi:hypothetical protein